MVASRVTENMLNAVHSIEKVASFDVTSSAASLELLDIFTADADNYFALVNYYEGDAVSQLNVQLSDDSGSSWQTSGYRSMAMYALQGNAQAVIDAFAASAAAYPSMRQNIAGATRGSCCAFLIKQARSTTDSTFFHGSHLVDSNQGASLSRISNEGAILGTTGTVYDSMRFIPSAGNIDILKGAIYRLNI